MNLPIRVAGTGIEFPCAPGQTVLEAAESAGWSIPYSCRKGVCTTCAGGLCAGELAVRGRGTIAGPAEGILLCRAEPLGPVEIAPRRIAAQQPPERKTLTTVVYRVRRPAPRVTLLDLRFPIGRRAPFRAGQFLDVQLPGGDTRPYSLANSPQHNDAAELHVRTEPGGRFSEEIVGGLRPGDTVTVETPFGEFVLDDGDGPVLLLATGTGFAPIKSIVEDQIARRRRRPVHLYWGGRTEEDLYLGDLARRWAARHDWFSFTPVLSRPPAGWGGATGWVQQAVLADFHDLGDHEVFACGSEAMTTTALATLTREAGLPADRFHADAFVPAAEAVAVPD
ncbi:2Fe-2S iron-sulfur cluster-binding protein [Amycolatopsis acidiphila]|uniref:2Fe-2S iron-sulfur cluster binding domain-containing protein n=1 Tax=Amycolatopsis acidiphila TaxID=715473 RepID=A0A558AGD5_9PSEU|nr:2Fe-2S iron-sulfur cluster-binding protein [Amycolatopsis acidiphila]TVT23332.1 2Fe-2S iron-sulfur cluster binding domain-containing protein [Amycolatopsis acidiphila]UIJ56561.1 2Fe-2S iron-sulfur cluster-binding protein [Amycolatopsis acidiphila]GHG66668.1 CDP-6-deoxy-delta-3,4-glucoseen reductase [Amycolatopsis acidiphila]